MCVEEKLEWRRTLSQTASLLICRLQGLGRLFSHSQLAVQK
jgi:hypothetical protein